MAYDLGDFHYTGDAVPSTITILTGYGEGGYGEGGYGGTEVVVNNVSTTEWTNIDEP